MKTTPSYTITPTGMLLFNSDFGISGLSPLGCTISPPDWQSGGPGNPNPNSTLLLAEQRADTFGAATYAGGDFGYNEGGDTGGFTHLYSGTSVGTAYNDALSNAQPWLNTVTTDVNNGNLAAATQVLADNSVSYFDGAIGASTGDLGQGLADIGNGILQSIGAIGSAVTSATSFAEGNIASGIAFGAAAVSSAESAYKDYSTQAAHDAWNDVFNSIDQWFGTDDTTWKAALQGDIARGVSGAAGVHNSLFPQQSSIGATLTTPHAIEFALQHHI